MDNFTNEKPEHDRSKSRITEDFLYFRKYPDSRCADYINILNINSMETTKTTEKFQSVHKTFSYTPKSALTNQWSSLAFGIGMVIVPLIYPTYQTGCHPLSRSLVYDFDYLWGAAAFNDILQYTQGTGIGCTGRNHYCG